MVSVEGIEELFALEREVSKDKGRIDVLQGQGGMKPGMGVTLYENSSAARDVFDAADTALDTALGGKLSKVLFYGTQEDISEPEVSPAATTVYNLAAIAAARTAHPELREKNPYFLAPHSHGIITALIYDRVLGFEDGLRIGMQRGRLMYEAGREQVGRMVIVLGIGEDEANEQCHKVIDAAKKEDGERAAKAILEVSNNNSLKQVVVGGSKWLVDRLKAASPDLTILDLPLKLAAHTSLMKPTVPALDRLLRQVKHGDPVVPVIENGRIWDSANGIIKAASESGANKVDWVVNIQAVVRNGIKQVNEYGTDILTGLSRRIDKRLDLKKY